MGKYEVERIDGDEEFIIYLAAISKKKSNS
jgi:hypothetical protein